MNEAISVVIDVVADYLVQELSSTVQTVAVIVKIIHWKQLHHDIPGITAIYA